ncbi:MAG: cobalamin biosynthesis protein CbiM [Brevinematales bacterium]|nr:cobalamin biosynthesis protein CbiM [Brevinematales bacterium]
MHIPQYMLQGAICPVTAGIAAAGITTASVLALRAKEKPTALKFAAVTSLIFAAQMMNFPVMDGTSGHLIGTTLAILLLGAPFGVISMSIILAIQGLIFSDGGLNVLGANIINMALIGAIPGIILTRLYKNEKISANPVMKYGLLFAGAWLSTVLASVACALEIGVGGEIALAQGLPAMLSVHILIGIGEGLLTALLGLAFANQKVASSRKMSAGIPLVSAAVVALVLSPLASGFPDGLEWVAAKFNALHETAPSFVSPLTDYSVAGIANPALSTGIAGLIGVALTFGVMYLLGLVFNRKTVPQKI